jgi:hypothetical protein
MGCGSVRASLPGKVPAAGDLAIETPYPTRVTIGCSIVAEAKARQAAEGIKIELRLTDEDLALARQGRHRIEVSPSENFPPDPHAANTHVAEVIVTIGD